VTAAQRNEIIAYLTARKSVLYHPDRTWASSGPPWSSNAANTIAGYDQAIHEILTMPVEPDLDGSR
jgi:hypothetical protein